MLSTNAKSVLGKISSEDNESSLTGLGCCLLCLLSLSPFCLYLYLFSQEPLSIWISALSQHLLWIYHLGYAERKKMSSKVLLSNINPFAGSGLVGYAIGFALRKILNWMLIIIGFLAGVQLLQRYGYVSSVNWDKFGNGTSTQIQH
jgi:uncharacterized membrane protein (Fun14 family)